MYKDKKISKKRCELEMLQRGGGKGMSSFLKKFRRNHANTTRGPAYTRSVHMYIPPIYTRMYIVQ
jgi:hypothetical protein